jgi:hypothetical protein
MLGIKTLRIQSFIGDDLIVAANFKCQQLDITPYTITSELRDTGGLGAIVANLIVTKNAADNTGRIFGFKAVASHNDTALLTVDGDYAFDFKFQLGTEIQHSPRVAVEFLRRVTG